MTDSEKVSILRSAIERADKALDWVLNPASMSVGSFATGRKRSEWSVTVCMRVRRILRAAVKKTVNPAPKKGATEHKNSNKKPTGKEEEPLRCRCSGENPGGMSKKRTPQT